MKPISRIVDRIPPEIVVAHINKVSKVTGIPKDGVVGFDICLYILEQLLSQERMMKFPKRSRRIKADLPNYKLN